MIILLGADGSGKTVLAKKLTEQSNFPCYHFDMNSRYEDYLNPLVSLEMYNAVCDRFIFCEIPYSSSLSRAFQFSMKEFHNVVLLTLIQKPVIVLLTHKPSPVEYSKIQYLPYNKWDEVLFGYREFLNTHHIPHMEYDYAMSPISIGALLELEKRYSSSMEWWIGMHKKGWGAVGSPNPKVLLVAERLGPNNLQNLPFSHGPTGYMLTDMLTHTGTPLGKIAITNLVKSFRRDPRPPNKDDLELLHTELEHLKPEKVVFMGSVAKRGIKVAKDLGIQCEYLVHLGYYSHKGITDMRSYHAQWRNIMGMIPTLR